MNRVIFHLDMDAFYASVEQRDNPALKGKPLIVGAPPHQRGVVCAASYEARKYGVRSAMPSSTAKRLCPNGVFIPPRMSVYRQESAAIMRLIGLPGVILEQVSVDEAYLEVSALAQAVEPDVRLLEALPLAREGQKALMLYARFERNFVWLRRKETVAAIKDAFSHKSSDLTLLRRSHQ